MINLYPLKVIFELTYSHTDYQKNSIREAKEGRSRHVFSLNYSPRDRYVRTYFFMQVS